MQNGSIPLADISGAPSGGGGGGQHPIIEVNTYAVLKRNPRKALQKRLIHFDWDQQRFLVLDKGVMKRMFSFDTVAKVTASRSGSCRMEVEITGHRTYELYAHSYHDFLSMYNCFKNVLLNTFSCPVKAPLYWKGSLTRKGQLVHAQVIGWCLTLFRHEGERLPVLCITLTEVPISSVGETDFTIHSSFFLEKFTCTSSTSREQCMEGLNLGAKFLRNTNVALLQDQKSKIENISTHATELEKSQQDLESKIAALMREREELQANVKRAQDAEKAALQEAERCREAAAAVAAKAAGERASFFAAEHEAQSVKLTAATLSAISGPDGKPRGSPSVISTSHRSNATGNGPIAGALAESFASGKLAPGTPSAAGSSSSSSIGSPATPSSSSAAVASTSFTTAALAPLYVPQGSSAATPTSPSVVGTPSSVASSSGFLGFRGRRMSEKSSASSVASRHQRTPSGESDATGFDQASTAGSAIVISDSDSPVSMPYPMSPEAMAPFVKGMVLVKYCLNGASHKRFVRLTEDFSNVMWASPSKKSSTRLGNDSCKQLAIDRIVEVTCGTETFTFKQYISTKKKADPIRMSELCFSVVMTSFTLDLEAPSQSVRNVWVRMLRTLVEQQRNRDDIVLERVPRVIDTPAVVIDESA